jgi:DNA-binding response OmpR family regulator
MAHRLKSLFAAMDVELRFITTPLATALPEFATLSFDLLVLDADRELLADIGRIEEALVEEDAPSLLIIASLEQLASLHFPVRLKHDFIVRAAADIEYQLRLRQLLWPGEEAGSSDFVRLGSLTLNLATYQVKIDGVALDLTYLEYALLAFRITHPGRTYSRDALLRRVWGFDYYGGSRTVDVHVRRVRAKLGPDLAGHLETVRGVGYLWNT